VPHRFLIGSIAVVAALALTGPAARSQTVDPGDAVVLVTLDGARTEEIFGGLDVDVLKSTLKPEQKVEESAVYKRFWAETPEARRQKILPSFWTLVTEQGSIAGNRALGSSATLGNKHWFSYPGYSEILLGQAFDEDITSNDPIRQPRETVLERLKVKGHLTPAQVATFASWDVFNAIAEHTVGATTINAGTEPLDLAREDVQIMNRLQQEAASPWDHTRLDAFTFRQAMLLLLTTFAPRFVPSGYVIGSSVLTRRVTRQKWPAGSLVGSGTLVHGISTICWPEGGRLITLVPISVQTLGCHGSPLDAGAK